MTRKPSIDIFLPVCGEDLEVMQNTWEGVVEMNNDQKYTLHPVVLDDKGDFRVAQLAQRFGFTYYSRPNKGEMKKAGNLKFGFQRTEGEFFVIFDADFRPRHDFIEELLPYMSDPKNAIVQSPQFFDFDKSVHKKSLLEYGAGGIQSYFYRIIQPARDLFGGAICVGSCALYRREALEKFGGVVQIEHSEDVYTGFHLLNHGYKVKYVPLPLSKGVCPDDLVSFLKQQRRWCNGSMSLLVDRDFWKSRIGAKTKLCYISGFMYYLSIPLKLILVLASFFLISSSHIDFSQTDIAISLFSIGVVILLYSFYIYPRARIGTVVAHSCVTWTITSTIIALTVGHKDAWVPTGLQRKANFRLLLLYFMVSSYILASLYLIHSFIAGQGIVLNSMDFFSPIIFWDIVAITYNSVFFLYGMHYIAKLYRESRNTRIYFLSDKGLRA